MRLLHLTLLLAPYIGAAQNLHFGTNLVRAGETTFFNAPITARARWEVTRAGKQVQSAKGAFILPPGRSNIRTGIAVHPAFAAPG